MIVVDSSVWVDFFNKHENEKVEKLKYALINDIILTLDLIKIEVLQGFKSQLDYEIANDLFSGLIYDKALNERNVYKSIDNRRFLRNKGITIRKTIDVIIGTYCIENKIPLLHKDSDFSLMAKRLELTEY